MYKLMYSLIALAFISCKSTTYFIVRHAEKETATSNISKETSISNMSTDVTLSEAGKQRAVALKDLLQNERITQIYSTNYIRTKTTAKPIAESLGISIQTYNPGDSVFINQLRRINNGSVLIVGHSNTVDDLVNNLSGEKLVTGDLPDSQYGDLYIIKKKNNKIKYEMKHFGK
ncbi:MAG: SixA phosphatase family protein [Flavisolibacter sp.]